MQGGDEVLWGWDAWLWEESVLGRYGTGDGAAVRQFPELVRASEGDDWAYARWLTLLLGEARKGRLPSPGRAHGER